MSFYLSKIIWLIFNPFNIFIFLTILCLLLYFLNFRKKSKILFILNFIYISLISFFPIGNYLIYQIEKEYHSQNSLPKNLDGILVLGGATNPILFKEFNQISLNSSAERLVVSVQIINKFKTSKVIFSGGSGIINRPDLGHASAAKRFYRDMGIETEKIKFENKSRNTFENIVFSKKIANPKSHEQWLIITSASHMKRALLVASKNNWQLIPFAVDFKTTKNFKLFPNFRLLYNLNTFQEASHEWLGIVFYYLTNRINKIL